MSADLKTDDFDWSPLGESFWRDCQNTVGANERQLRFACVKHRGTVDHHAVSNTQAARLAGYTTDGEAIRQVAYRTFRSDAVQRLLAFASAEMRGSTDGTVDGIEAKRILSGLARGGDPSVKIRAVESLMKMEELERAPKDDPPSLDEMLRQIADISPVLAISWASAEEVPFRTADAADEPARLNRLEQLLVNELAHLRVLKATVAAALPGAGNGEGPVSPAARAEA